MIWLSSPFFFADIQILMGSLVYLRHGIENSPYRSLLETNQWAEICNIFTRDACALLGLSVESPLSVRYERKTELYFWFCCHPSLSFFIKDLNPSFSWLFLFFLEQYQIILVWFSLVSVLHRVAWPCQCWWTSNRWLSRDSAVESGPTKTSCRYELKLKRGSLVPRLSTFIWADNSFFIFTRRLKSTWGRNAGTTLCLPARFSGSKPRKATLPWSSSVATSSPEMPSTNSPMRGSKSTKTVICKQHFASKHDF